jgi:hypothetical protein
MFVDPKRLIFKPSELSRAGHDLAACQGQCSISNTKAMTMGPIVEEGQFDAMNYPKLAAPLKSILHQWLCHKVAAGGKRERGE